MEKRELSKDVIWEGLKIYKTLDYDKFVLMKGNRKVKPFQVNRLKASYKKGQVPVPLVVNQFGELVDGQHRREALRQLGLAVPYMIVKDAGIKEVQRLNTQQTNWSIQNHLDCYVERGKKMYIKYNDEVHLKFYFDHTTKITLIKGGASLTGAGPKEHIQAFKDGEFEATEGEFKHAIETGRKIEAVDGYFFKHIIFSQRRCLWNAVRRLVDYRSFNHAEMIKKLEVQKFKIGKQLVRFTKLTTDEFLNILESIYNHGRHGELLAFATELKVRSQRRKT